MNAAAAGGVEDARLHGSLAAAAASLRVPISSEQAARLVAFVGLLFHWNGTYNLTAIRDLSGILTHHVIDCLAAVPPLRRQLSQAASARILDVGSGGGLPGLIFAVMQPEFAVTCIDSVGKKAAFLRQAAATLALRNLDVAHGRVEALGGEPFDLIASRAFASLSDFTRLTAPLLKSSGSWMAMKGRRPDDEILALPAGTEMFHVEPLSVPELTGERCLVWMRKAGGHEIQTKKWAHALGNERAQA